MPDHIGSGVGDKPWRTGQLPLKRSSVRKRNNLRRGRRFSFKWVTSIYRRHKKTNTLPYSFFSGTGRLLESGSVFEKTHFKVGGGIDNHTINQYFTVSNAHDQFTVDHAFEVQAVSHHFRRRQYLTGEFNFAHTQCAAFAFTTEPAQIESNQLPHGIQAKTAWHYRITDEMTAEEPQIRIDIQFGFDIAFAMGAAVFLHFDDTIHHQHIA